MNSSVFWTNHKNRRTIGNLFAMEGKMHSSALWGISAKHSQPGVNRETPSRKEIRLQMNCEWMEKGERGGGWQVDKSLCYIIYLPHFQHMFLYHSDTSLCVKHRWSNKPWLGGQIWEGLWTSCSLQYNNVVSVLFTGRNLIVSVRYKKKIKICCWLMW